MRAIKVIMTDLIKDTSVLIAHEPGGIDVASALVPGHFWLPNPALSDQ